MKKMTKFAMMAAIAVAGTIGFSACSSTDEVVNEESKVVLDGNGVPSVRPEFVISIPRTVIGTRMENGITQNEGSVAQFRGMDNIRLLSFNAVPTTSSTKLSDILRLSPIQTINRPGFTNYKVYADQFVPVGTKNFLFYGKAIDATADKALTTMDEKFHYGTLTTFGLNDAEFNTVNDIAFGLEQINTSPDRQQNNVVGKAIVDLFTSMALTTGWATATNTTLKNLYKSFTCVTTGSSKTAAVILSKVYAATKHVQSSDPEYAVAQELQTKILNACEEEPVVGSPAKLKAEYQGYPANIGLPDGAARISWRKTGSNPNTFYDITGNYNQGNKVAVTNYVYPANLWYYTNTPLKASTQIESPEYDVPGNWEGLIGFVYDGAADEVQDNTQSVALVNQAQYGVGRLETKIQMPSGKFYDGAGKEVVVGTGYTLTGVLLGGQCSVGYDFAKKGDENYTLYDREMSYDNIIAKPNSTTSNANQTLALQTASNQVVYAAIELVNGGEEFLGLDGIIPAGGTFYLTAKLDPTTASNYLAGTLDKIIYQDHVTKLTITIKNGKQEVDRDGDGNPDKYIKDGDGKPTGVDKDGDGTPDPYDIDGDGNNDTFITDPDHGGPGWDTDGDGEVDIPVIPDGNGDYPDNPNVNEGLGNATNGIPDLSSPGIELGTSVNLEWQEGLIINPEI